MKLLLDQNLSHKLVTPLTGLGFEVLHVRDIEMTTASDRAIWEWARDTGVCIVTYDADFSELVAYYGYPPKVLWLRVGNQRSSVLANLFEQKAAEIKTFLEDATAGVFTIE
jgi:predicted nuclease of predicted toxin-antitoxin system